jgi:hypothetical protein
MGGLVAPGGSTPTGPSARRAVSTTVVVAIGISLQLPLGGQLSRAGGLNAQPGRDTPQYGVVGAALEIGAWRVWGAAAC